VHRVTKETLPSIGKWLLPNNANSYNWPAKGAAFADKPIRSFDHVGVTFGDSGENGLLISGAKPFECAEIKRLLLPVPALNANMRKFFHHKL